MRPMADPLGVCSADYFPILVIGVQNVARDIQIGMLPRIVFVLFYLLLSRMNLRHRINAGRARRSLLLAQYRQYAIELLPGDTVLLTSRFREAQEYGRDQSDAEPVAQQFWGRP